MRRIQQQWLKLVRQAYDKEDSFRLRGRKEAFLSLAVLLLGGALAWCAIAAVLMPARVYWVPLAYGLFVAIALYFLFRTRKLDGIRDFVLFISVLFPFVLQWLIGGFVASGFVMLWAILPLMGSWVCSPIQQTQRWLFLFIAMMIISGFLDNYFIELFATETNYVRLLLIFNGTFLGLFSFWVAILFVRNEKRLRALLEGHIEAVNRTLATAEYSPTGRILTANARFRKIIGYNKDELPGKKYNDFVPSTLSERDQLSFWKKLTDGIPQVGTFQLRARENEQLRWLAGTYSPVFDEYGNVRKILQITRDVTRERRRLSHYEAQIRAFNRTNATVRLNETGQVEQGNANFASLLGYSLIELRGKYYAELISEAQEQNLRFEEHWKEVLDGRRTEGEYLHTHQNGEERWLEVFFYLMDEAEATASEVLLVLHDITERKNHESELHRLRDQALNANKELSEKNQVLEEAAEILDEKNKEIKEQHAQMLDQSRQLEKQSLKVADSIQYASRIQHSILTDIEKVESGFDDAFVMLVPRDKVSGDFYWFAQVGDRTIIIAADCTGHGVPGAFMSLIGHNLLDQMVRMMGMTSPEMMLSGLHMGIQKTLRQKETQNRDGMDITICCIDHSRKVLEFAGAKNPLVYFQDGEMHLIKGDRMPVGGLQKEKRRVFTKHEIDLVGKETIFYIFSDGFQDQFGGPRDRKFGGKRFRSLLESIHSTPLHEQKTVLETTLTDWKGEQEQIDDVLVIGAKISFSESEE